MACAQCHTHKYDPITQDEYFQFFAFFNNTTDNDQRDERPTIPVFSRVQKEKKGTLEVEITKLKAILQAQTPELETAQKKWESSLKATPEWEDLRGSKVDVASDEARPTGFQAGELDSAQAQWTPKGASTKTGRYVRVILPGKNKFLSLAEVQILSSGKNIALEGKASQSSTAFGGPASLANDGNTDGDFSRAKSTTHTAQSNDPWWEIDLGKEFPVEEILVWNRMDGGQSTSNRLKEFSVSLLDEGRQSIWSISPDEIPRPSLGFSLHGPRQIKLIAVTLPGTKTPILASAQKLPKGAGTLTLPPEVHSFTRTEAVSRWATIPSKVREGDATALSHYYRSIAPLLQSTRDRLAVATASLKAIKPMTTVPVFAEMPKDKRRKTHLQIRGSHQNKGHELHEGVPSAIHPFPEGKERTRLTLAEWLIGKDNPLTARVIANRHWEQLFGAGIVLTSEEFGSQGDLPSHPLLLDWLAVELMDSGWDLKALIKTIVMSATYRQSSSATEDDLERDIRNRQLSRGPRARLSAEMIRDQALHIAGLLSPKMYGPPARPPMPKLGLRAAFGGSTDWEDSKGEDRYRRGLYTEWRRSQPYPSMDAFDAPNREVCTVRRLNTNTPLQALVTMNDPVYIEAAQALGRRVLSELPSAELNARLSRALKLAIIREPSTEEVSRLEKLYHKAHHQFISDNEAAHAMATNPIGDAPEGIPITELAAWTVVGNVILNLDETLQKP